MGKSEEAYGELAAHLCYLARKWMSECHTVEEVLEKLVVKQLASTVPMKLHIWVAERKSATIAEAGRLADDYLQARRHIRHGNQENRKERNNGAIREPRKCHNCGAEGHLKWNCPIKEAPKTGNPNNCVRSSEKPVKC